MAYLVIITIDKAKVPRAQSLTKTIKFIPYIHSINNRTIVPFGCRLSALPTAVCPESVNFVAPVERLYHEFATN
jgi:hypothetical protein